MKNKGFSFIELLVAVAILGIISLPIVSSFTLAAKTDAKATHLSAMNDAADDVLLLLKETEGKETEGIYDKDGEANPLERINTAIISFDALLQDLQPLQPEDQLNDKLDYTFKYNGYNVSLSVKRIDGCYYRADITVSCSVSGDTLEVNRKGLLKYA